MSDLYHKFLQWCGRPRFASHWGFFCFFLPCTCLYTAVHNYNWKCVLYLFTMIRYQLVNAVVQPAVLCSLLPTLCVGQQPQMNSQPVENALACSLFTRLTVHRTVEPGPPTYTHEVNAALSTSVCNLFSFLCRSRPLTPPLSRSPSCSCPGTVRPRWLRVRTWRLQVRLYRVCSWSTRGPSSSRPKLSLLLGRSSGRPSRQVLSCFKGALCNV